MCVCGHRERERGRERKRARERERDRDRERARARGLKGNELLSIEWGGSRDVSPMLVNAVGLGVRGFRASDPWRFGLRLLHAKALPRLNSTGARLRTMPST